jgi:uncharacterized protein
MPACPRQGTAARNGPVKGAETMPNSQCNLRACALPWFSLKVVQRPWPVVLTCLSVAATASAGLVTVDVTAAEAAARDLATLIPVMLLILGALVGLMLSSASGALATVMVVGISVATLLGLAGWSGLILSPVLAVSALLVLGLTATNCLYLTAALNQQLRLGLPKRQALARILVLEMKPLFLSSVIMAAGFLCLNLSPIPLLGDLGRIVAMGMSFGYLYTILFFPASMAILPHRLERKGRSQHDGALVPERR